MSYLEPPRAKEKLRKITEFCRYASVYLGRQIPWEIRDRLADLWYEYIKELPPEVVAREGIAIIGYPQIVLLKDIPRKIREDPFFASLIIRWYGEMP